MFKDIQAGLSKFLGKRWIPIILILVVSFALISYSTSKNTIIDRMTDGSYGGGGGGAAPPSLNRPSAPILASPSAPSPGIQLPAATVGGYAMQPVANPSDLLPKDPNSQWAALNPVNQSNVAMPDLLQAGYHIGLDTIGQTMKNPNLQIRSDPIIQKQDVGPWNNSTTEADYARVPLELGYGGR
jgi:hypothetical protein